jgi:predicted pyridoxine 5'-phosphate oxidase superfamily flavin-nucleotide-binding protein
MSSIPRISSDVAFTPAVKAIQERKGSRRSYARMEQNGGFRTEIDADLAALLGAQISVFLGTASAAGQPYIQHRGGPPGFLRVLDPHTIAFADYRGNRQYITSGNLAENPKACLFLIDYEDQSRVKIWGEARIVEGDAALLGSLMPAGYDAHPEQALIFRVTAWDANCPQHIPRRLEAAQVEAMLAEKDAKIAALSAELEALRRR